VEKLTRYDIAFGVINDLNLLARHPHLRRVSIGTPTGPASMPAPAAIHDGAPRDYGAVPALGEHTEAIKNEFAVVVPRTRRS
jgi:itaconate CoA-transferase